MKTLSILLITALPPALCRAQHTDTSQVRADSARLREIRIIGQGPAMERKLDRVVIRVDAILSNAGENALGVLENTPGVGVDENGNISLNGKAGVLVLIDDRPTYLEGQALANFLRALPASRLSTVELMTTPPARYEASGAAGIIVLRTRKDSTGGRRVQFSSAGTQGIAGRWDNSVTWNEDRGAWALSAATGFSGIGTYYQSQRYREFSMPVVKVTQTLVEQSAQTNVPWTLGVDHRGRLSWGLLTTGYANPYHEHGNYADSFYSVHPYPDSTTGVQSHYHSHNVDQDGNAHLLWSSPHAGRSVSADADFVYYRSEASQYETSVTTPGASTFGLLTNQPFTARIYSLKADYNDRLPGEVALGAGVQATWSARTSSGVYLDGEGALSPDDSLDNRFTYRENINAAYVSLRREHGRFSLQAGLRIEQTNGYGDLTAEADSVIRLHYLNAFPSMQASLRLDSAGRHRLFLSFGRRIDRPGYGDLNPSTFFQDRYTYFTGNPLLQPEFTDRAELSYTRGSRFTLTARYSRTAAPMALAYLADGTSFFYYSVNLDQESEAGLESSLDVPLYGGWQAALFGQWVLKHYRGAPPGGSYLDKEAGYLAGSGSLRYTWARGWAAEISGSYSGPVLYGEAVVRPIGKCNASLRKRLWNDRATVTLTGNDLLGTWINARFIYLPDGLAHFRNDFYRRAAILTFTYTWGKGAGSGLHRTGLESEKARLGG